MSERALPIPLLSGESSIPGQPRVGVILAAGRSERLSRLTRGGSKALLRIGGVSLVERAVKRLLRIGLHRVVVVVGYRGEKVAASIDRLRLDSVQTARAEAWEEGNGASLAAAEQYVIAEPRFLLVAADHLFGYGSLEELVLSDDHAALIDHAPDRDAWDEGTRVRLRGDIVTALSKEFDAPAIDCGAFVLSPAVFDAQRHAAKAGDGSLSGAISRLAVGTPIRAVALKQGAWCIDVDTPADVRRAKTLLRRSLGRSSDGPISRYVNRPISTRLTMAIAPVRPSPDVLSLVGLFLGVAAAWALSLGISFAGALLATATSIIDGVDGEIARLQQRDGPHGALLDGVLDRLTDASILAGLAVWAYHLGFGSVAVIVLSVGATAVSLLSMATKDRISALSLPPAPERVIGFMLGGRDGRLLLIGVAALFKAPFLGLCLVVATGGVSLLARLASISLTRRSSSLRQTDALT
jgi:1L-myo-inositol 1-phosphate cytidylyltransferase / CDP-L-myo-inositol myo-inositolphosphotransferase